MILEIQSIFMLSFGRLYIFIKKTHLSSGVYESFYLFLNFMAELYSMQDLSSPTRD